MEVSPAQRHPASQQGGRGRWKPGWRILGEDGGWRFFTILLISYKKIWFSINLWVELNEEEIAWMKVKVFIWILQILNNLCAVDWRVCPSTSFQPSLRGRDEPNESESFVTHLDLLVNFSGEYQCLIRSGGRKYSYDDSVKSKYTSLLLQSKII